MSQNPVPPSTNDERRENLKRAMASRKRQAEVKKQLKEGTLKVSDVLSMEDEFIQNMKLFSLLKAIPGVGAAKAQAYMEKNHISKSKRLKGLGKHQRAALVEKYG